MSERKWTDLERRIRWFFKNCEDWINGEVLDLIVEANWNRMRDKLVFSIEPNSPKFANIVELAKKINNLESK